jgi:hypothetical protein
LVIGCSAKEWPFAIDEPHAVCSDENIDDYTMRENVTGTGCDRPR